MLGLVTLLQLRHHIHTAQKLYFNMATKEKAMKSTKNLGENKRENYYQPELDKRWLKLSFFAKQNINVTAFNTKL